MGLHGTLALSRQPASWILPHPLFGDTSELQAGSAYRKARSVPVNSRLIGCTSGIPGILYGSASTHRMQFCAGVSSFRAEDNRGLPECIQMPERRERLCGSIPISSADGRRRQTELEIRATHQTCGIGATTLISPFPMYSSPLRTCIETEILLDVHFVRVCIAPERLQAAGRRELAGSQFAQTSLWNCRELPSFAPLPKYRESYADSKRYQSRASNARNSGLHTAWLGESCAEECPSTALQGADPARRRHAALSGHGMA